MSTTGLYGTTLLSALPPQMISKSRKNKEWKEACMDALETIGKAQFRGNLRLIENYEMVKGKFIFGHYFEQDDYVDMISQLTKEFELPSYLRHYDIISQVINTLSGEWQSRPDVFRVKGHDESTTNEYVRRQSELLINYVTSKINVEVNRKLLERGLDPDKQDFGSQEEAQAYQQAVDQARQQLTPPEIQEYMSTDWFAAAEIWGQHQLELDRKRYRIAEKEKREFEDMVIADRCFRHFYLTPDGYNQETWNPVNVFFHKSPDVDYVEEGDFVGRVFYLTVPDIIDRYGYRMSKKQLEVLRGEAYDKKGGKWNYMKGTDWVYNDYSVPFKDYKSYNLINQSLGFKNIEEQGIPNLNAEFFSNLHDGTFHREGRGYFCVVEAYWKSQKKIGKVTYIDPETGLLTKILVDEDFVVPDGFTVLDAPFDDYDTDEVNTVVWTWINETWKGVKINTKGISDLGEDLYLDVMPLQFQFKGDLNPYYCKLPVCGQIFSVRNSQSMSLVDLMKPHQIGHNVAMNQAYNEMQKDVGKFIVMDVNMFPDAKDWGGEAAMEKWMLVAKELGVTVADTSPANSNNAAAVAGGHMPKLFDMDASSRIVSRLQIAREFEQMALKQIGFNDYRLGQQNSSSSATGVREGQARSFSQTETYFTNFSNYIQRCHKMNLDIAQYVQSQNKDVTISYVKSDMSRAFMKMNGTELLMADLHVYVSNSQEEIRQLETLRQLAIQNNTSGATMLDLAEIVTANSPAAIKAKLKVSQARQQENLDRQYELQQQQIEQQAQIAQLREQKEDERLAATIEGKKEVAYINTYARQLDNERDVDTNNVPDILEYDKLNNQASQADSKHEIEREKLQIARQKEITDREIKLRKLELEQRKLEQQRQIQKEELEYARIMKGKKDQ